MKGSYHVYALIGVAFWSLPNVFTRLAMEHFSATSVSYLRFLIASAVLVVVAIVGRVKPPAVRDLPLFIAGGVIGFGIYMVIFSLGQSMVGSATGSVIIAVVPVCTALVALKLFRERLAPVQWFATVIEFFGVLVLTLLEGVLQFNVGVFWMLGAVGLFTAYNLIQRLITRTYSGLQASIYCIFLGTIFLALISPGAYGELATATPNEVFDLIVLGIGPSAISYVTWAIAIQKAATTAQVTNYMFVTPFLVAIVAFLIAGEVPTLATYLGGGIILAGVALFNFAPRKLANQED